MTTQTKRIKNQRRTAQQRSADHRRTVEQLSELIADVYNAEQDGLLYCGAIRLAHRRTPWIQVAPGVMSLWWPYAESPHVVLFRDVPCSLRVRILDWTDDGFAMVSFRGKPNKVAGWVDDVFRHVYNCKVGYAVEVELNDLSSDAR